MKFKLDECVDARLSINLKQAGYEATTVHEQGLHGIEDERLYHLCTVQCLEFRSKIHPRDCGTQRARRSIGYNSEVNGNPNRRS